MADGKESVINALIFYFTNIIIFVTMLIACIGSYPILFPKSPEYLVGALNLFGLLYVVISILVSYWVMHYWVSHGLSIAQKDLSGK